MKKNKTLFYLFLFIATVFAANCKKVPIGSLSDNIRYNTDTLVFAQGQTLTSAGILTDNSTQPFKITLLNIRNRETGIREESFFKDFSVITWKAPFDPTKDTTVELIKAKQTTTMMKPVNLLEASGQFIINSGSANIPVGYYTVDIQISNPNGTKTYTNICTIRVMPFVEIQYPSIPYFIAVRDGTETGVRFSFDDQWINSNIGQSTTATFRVKKIADAPNQIVFKVTDKNGAVFPGVALEKRPSGNSFSNTLGNFSVKTTVTDTAILYDYPLTTRFPDPYWDNQPNGILCYYRINAKYIASIDTADTKNWFPPVSIPYGTWNQFLVKANIRFSTILNSSGGGKYLYELKLRLTKK